MKIDKLILKFIWKKRMGKYFEKRQGKLPFSFISAFPFTYIVEQEREDQLMLPKRRGDSPFPGGCSLEGMLKWYSHLATSLSVKPTQCSLKRN